MPQPKVYKYVDTHNFMSNITLAIPDELYAKMKRHEEIKWSSIVRRILKERLDDLERADALVSKSKLTEKDAWDISEKIKEAAWKRTKASLSAHGKRSFPVRLKKGG